LEGLLEKKPERRLGNSPNGVEDIKNHPWFAEINWDTLLKKEIKPPFTPIIKSPDDVTYFSEEFTTSELASFKDK
jgi:hypothetical protein